MTRIQRFRDRSIWRRLGWVRPVAVLMLAAMTGCASCPPFKASWYLDEIPAPKPPADAAAPSMAASGPEGSASAIPIVYLVLLNEGSEEVYLQKVIVNPKQPKRSWWQKVLPVEPAKAGHMAIQPERGEKSPLPQTASEGELPTEKDSWNPGEFRVFRVVDTSHLADETKACSLPVSVQIECTNGCSRTTTVSGALPNFLHTTWTQNCQPLKPLGVTR